MQTSPSTVDGDLRHDGLTFIVPLHSHRSPITNDTDLRSRSTWGQPAYGTSGSHLLQRCLRSPRRAAGVAVVRSLLRPQRCPGSRPGCSGGGLIGGDIGYFVVSVEAIRDLSLVRFCRLAAHTGPCLGRSAAHSGCGSRSRLTAFWSNDSAGRQEWGVLHVLAFMATRGLGWLSLGLAVGLSEGIAARSLGKLSYGMLGGAIGGFVGGSLFGLFYYLGPMQDERGLPAERRDLRRLASSSWVPASARCRPWCRACSSRPRCGCCAAGRRARVCAGQGRQCARPRRARRHRPVPRHAGREDATPSSSARAALYPGQQRKGRRSRHASTAKRSPMSATCTTATVSSWATSCCASSFGLLK